MRHKRNIMRTRWYWLLAGYVACCACKGREERSTAVREKEPEVHQPQAHAPRAQAEAARPQAEAENARLQGLAEPEGHDAPAPPAAAPDEIRRQAEAARLDVERAAAATTQQAVADVQRTQDTIDQLTKDLAALDARLDQAIRLVVSATTDADRTAAQASVAELMKQRGELQQRMAAAKAAAANAERAQGVHVSKECLENPLAKGCS
jgi:DNA repair exonuclease SbcCD ATPase subunit